MGTVSEAIALLLAAIDAAGKIAPIIAAAQAAGQTTLTADQWAIITGADDSAEAGLTAAIAIARAAGK